MDDTSIRHDGMYKNVTANTDGRLPIIKSKRKMCCCFFFFQTPTEKNLSPYYIGIIRIHPET